MTFLASTAFWSSLAFSAAGQVEAACLCLVVLIGSHIAIEALA